MSKVLNYWMKVFIFIAKDKCLSVLKLSIKCLSTGHHKVNSKSFSVADKPREKFIQEREGGPPKEPHISFISQKTVIPLLLGMSAKEPGIYWKLQQTAEDMD